MSLKYYFLVLCICNYNQNVVSKISRADKLLELIDNLNYLQDFNELENRISYTSDLQHTYINSFPSSDKLLRINYWPEPPTTDEQIRKNGYPCEIHDIVTEDGYILRVFRIPHGRNTTTNKHIINRPPLLLQHGILCSSDCWVLSDPSRGLGYRLADEGYDVWINNNRGTTYSRRHKTLSIHDPKYWDFGLHELGTKDLPAVIDYMLNNTKYENITYVGHSQGTTQFFILTSVLPQYNKKILVMSAMAPVAFLDHMKGLPQFFSHFSKIIKFFANLFGIYNVLDHSTFIDIMNHLLCRPNSIFRSICDDVFFIIVGFDSPQLNKTLVEVISDYCPTGASMKQLEHFSQFTKGRFAWFDYGPKENEKKYNSILPPQYNLSQITAPVVLHYGVNDYISTQPEVQRLFWLLPNIVGLFRVPYDLFNHVDFMWAIDVNELLYNQAIYIIKKFL